MLAGTAQARISAAPPSSARPTPAYQRRLTGRCSRLHHGANSATGIRCNSATGPLAYSAPPRPSANHTKPRRPPSCHATAVPSSRSATKKLNIASNISAVAKYAYSALASNTKGAARATIGRCGHSRRPSAALSASVAAANSGEISHGHHSLTPNTAQPACISQNSSGGLWW